MIMVQSIRNTKALHRANQKFAASKFGVQANTASCVLCSTKFFAQHKTTCPLAFGSGAIYSKVVNRERSITNS